MNSQHDQTFRIDRLYFQFLKKHDVPAESLIDLAYNLQSEGFIKLVPQADGAPRYIETKRLTSQQHRNELFKYIQQIVNQWRHDHDTTND